MNVVPIITNSCLDRFMGNPLIEVEFKNSQNHYNIRMLLFCCKRRRQEWLSNP
jgi:hypothetical protein